MTRFSIFFKKISLCTAVYVLALPLISNAQGYQKTTTGAKAVVNGTSVEVHYWSGEKLTGGQKVSKETPLDIIPIYAKAGAVIPVGPAVQYAVKKNWDNLKVSVYPGANGDFTLYEDEYDNYNYENGKFSEIKFHWDDKSRTLKIADRTGAFTGMLQDRKFDIVIAPAGSNMGNSKIVKSVAYNGKAINVKL